MDWDNGIVSDFEDMGKHNFHFNVFFSEYKLNYELRGSKSVIPTRVESYWGILKLLK